MEQDFCVRGCHGIEGAVLTVDDRTYFCINDVLTEWGEIDVSTTSLARTQGNQSVFFHLMNGGVDGLFGKEGMVCNIFLTAAVAQLADGIIDIKGTVGKSKALRSSLIN